MKYLLILSALFLASCASKPAQIPQVKIIQHPIDLDKVKTFEDLRALYFYTLPENPVANTREDSFQDSKKLESIKHLLKDKK